MRISDWSSDVCSSDLDALEHLAHDRGPRGVGETVRVMPLGQRREPVLERVMRELPGVGSQIARHLIGSRRQMTAPVDLEVTGRARVRALGIGAGGRIQVLLDRRSEEHTSELQSLLRISYAVFCLKKKQNHQ